MNVRRGIRLSVRALLAQKTRALLALASVSIGVAAVVLISAVAAGVQAEVNRKMEATGTNLIVVRPAQVESVVARKTIRGVVKTLKVDDSVAIAGLPSVSAAAPGVESAIRVKAGNTATITKVLGTTEAFPAVRNFRVREGRFFDGDDDDNARRVAVLGAGVADALFASRSAVHQEIRVRGVPFEVIGILEAKGVSTDGSDEDNQVLVPLRTALRRVFNTTSLMTIFVSASRPERIDETLAAIDAVLSGRHRRRDFAIQNTMKLVATQKQTADFLATLGLGLGAIALFVGGTGILALMMMSVKQRTSEIGLRMALGATPGNILLQFLCEATLLALGGWLLGLIIAAVLGLVMAFATEWSLAVPGDALLATAAMVLITGLGFGTLPARRASMLPPTEALRLR